MGGRGGEREGGREGGRGGEREGGREGEREGGGGIGVLCCPIYSRYYLEELGEALAEELVTLDVEFEFIELRVHRRLRFTALTP